MARVKKTAKRVSTRKKPAQFRQAYIGYIIVALGVLMLIVVGKSALDSFTTSHVLGASTLIARGGDDNGGTLGGGSEDSTSGSNSSLNSQNGSPQVVQTSNSGSGGPESDHPLPPQNGVGEAARPLQQHGKPVFAAPTVTPKVKQSEIEDEQEDTTVESEDTTETTDLTEDGTTLELGLGHNLAVRKKDGSQVMLNQAALDKVNKLLASDDLAVDDIATGSVSFSHNGVRTRTHFPLSINPVTHELTVTTPAGTKVVTILPDEAVQNMIAKGFITTVASGSGALTGSSNEGQSASGSGDTTATDSTGEIALTDVNNQPVYEFEGKSAQKFLGFIPVSITKTLDVSAESGDLVKTQESFLQNVLDFFSF